MTEFEYCITDIFSRSNVKVKVMVIGRKKLQNPAHISRTCLLADRVQWDGQPHPSHLCWLYKNKKAQLTQRECATAVHV